jgi:hypothetical protein
MPLWNARSKQDAKQIRVQMAAEMGIGGWHVKFGKGRPRARGWRCTRGALRLHPATDPIEVESEFPPCSTAFGGRRDPPPRKAARNAQWEKKAFGWE